MFGTILKLLMGPLASLGEKWLDNQRDAHKLREVSNRIAMAQDTVQRVNKWQYAILRFPLFLGETLAVLYFGAVMVDSTFPSDWFNPLELPGWFQPHFGTALASIFGIAAAERILRR